MARTTAPTGDGRTTLPRPGTPAPTRPETPPRPNGRGSDMRRFLPRFWGRRHQGTHRPDAVGVATTDRRPPATPAPAPSRLPQSSGPQHPSGGSPARTAPNTATRPVSPTTAAPRPHPSPQPRPVPPPHEIANADGADIMRLVDELCIAYAKVQVAQTMAEFTSDPEARAKHLGVARYWTDAGRKLHRTISESLDDALTAEASLESFLPVQPTPTGEVALRAHDAQHRPVVVRLTATQALAVGAHLTAYAAIGLDRTGRKVADVLPPIATQPPFIAPKAIPTPGPAPAAYPRGTAATRPAAR